MNHTKQLAASAAGGFVLMSLAAFVPAANADVPAARADDGSTTSRPDLGFARNGGIDDVAPSPGGVPGPADTGIDTSDAVVGTLAGLAVAGGGMAAVIAIRRRHPVAHHPA